MPFPAAFGQPLLDLLYPPKCGICGKLGPRGLCEACRTKFTPAPPNLPAPQPLTSIHAPYLYQDEVATAIQRLKFDRITPLAEPLSEILKDFAKEIPYDMIIPVPTARDRRSTRGFNQAELLAQAFPKEIVFPQYLKRTRYTRPQIGLSAKDRLLNLKNAFSAPHPVTDQKILLLDDVITSGGTAIECATELFKNGASEVRILTLAVQLGQHF